MNNPGFDKLSLAVILKLRNYSILKPAKRIFKITALVFEFYYIIVVPLNIK